MWRGGGDVLALQNTEKCAAQEEKEQLQMGHFTLNPLCTSNIPRETAAIRRHVLQQNHQLRNFLDGSIFRVQNEVAAIRGHIQGQQPIRNCPRDVSILRIQNEAAAIRKHILGQHQIRQRP